jgi:transposase-like protein
VVPPGPDPAQVGCPALIGRLRDGGQRLDPRSKADRALLHLPALELKLRSQFHIKRWTARRKAALVLEIIQGKTTVAEASRSFDITPSEIEEWVEEGKRGMENALGTKPLAVREEYERQLKELQEAYGEAMLELRPRKKLQSLLGEEEKGSRRSARDSKPTAFTSRSASCASGSQCRGARSTTSRPKPGRRSMPGSSSRSRR